MSKVGGKSSQGISHAGFSPLNYCPFLGFLQIGLWCQLENNQGNQSLVSSITNEKVIFLCQSQTKRRESVRGKMGVRVDEADTAAQVVISHLREITAIKSINVLE